MRHWRATGNSNNDYANRKYYISKIMKIASKFQWQMWGIRPRRARRNCPRRLRQPEMAIYSVSQKIPPPEIFWYFFPNGWEFFVQILQTCYTFLSTLNYNFLFNYLQLWRSYAILSVTTQFTSHVQNVHHRPKRALAFSDIFPKQLGSFSPNFTCLLHVPMYVRLRIVIQLSPTLTKLCHIKCDHLACVSADGGHYEHMMAVALNMA